MLAVWLIFYRSPLPPATPRWLQIDNMRNSLQQLVINWSLDIPFERSVRLNLIALEGLQEDGLTWSSIAGVLTQAGARHKNGHPISARQMNTVFLRVQKAMRMTLIADASPQLQPTTYNVPILSAPVKSAIQTRPAIKARENFDKVLSKHSASRRSDGLAQRLSEASRMRGAARLEYDE
jgi:hypothetical protein